MEETTEAVVEAVITEATEEKKKVNNRTVRFSGADWYHPGKQIIIGGVGGIGSWLCHALARQEAELFLFDMDTVDETNMGGQHFRTSDIGRNKVDVIQEQIREYSGGVQVTAFGRYDENSPAGNLMMSAFDNMAARKLMFEKWVEYIETPEGKFVNGKDGKLKEALFVDGRLLAEDLKVFAVDRNHVDKYRTYLWNDDEIADLDCTLKATTHCSMMIAGFMTTVYNNYLTNIKHNAVIRDVPFLTELALPILKFKMSDDEYTE